MKFNKKILLLFLITFIPFGVILYFYASSIPPFTAKENLFIYHDETYKTGYLENIHGDKTSEIVNVYSNRQGIPTAIVIRNIFTHAEEQYNLREKLTSCKLFFEDINNDNYKEIFLFTEKGDTLFLNIIDHKKKDFLLKRFPIIVNKPIFNSVWDKGAYFLGFAKNDSTKRYLYFVVHSRYSILPRSIYKFDLKTKKIVGEFNTATTINCRFVDINNDGIDEIICGSGCPRNTVGRNYNFKYPDNYPWTFLLDNNLELLKSSHLPDKGYSAQQYIPIKNAGNVKVFSNYSYTNKEQKNVIELSTLNSQLEKIDTLKLISNAYAINKLFNNYFPVINDNYLYFYNYKLKPIKKIKLLENPIIISPLKGEKDKNYFVVANRSRVQIINDKFEVILNSKLNEKIKNPHVNLTLGRTHQGNLCFMINEPGQGYFIYEARKNNILAKLFPLIIFYFIFLFLLVLSIYIFIIIQIYHSTINQTVMKSESAIILIKDNYTPYFVNKKAEEIFKIKKGYEEKFKSIVRKNDELNQVLLNATFKPTTEEISLSENNQTLRMIVRVIRFNVLFDLFKIVFLELTNMTEIIQRERTKVWIHSMQKIAHEIKTPLSSMLLNLKSIENDIQHEIVNKKEVVGDINIIKTEINRIKNLTNSLLKFADLQTTHFSNVNLYEVIDQVKSKFITFLKRDIQLNVTKFNKDLTVKADSYQVVEVFQAIVENSIDAMNGKGEINIDVIYKGEKIKIVITDKGPGIKRREIDKIFAPYYTTKKDGTGMGLAIAKKIVEDHGSKLTVISSIGKGTKFSFELNRGNK